MERISSDGMERISTDGLREEGRVRILLADNHTLFRAGLANILSSYNDLEIVGQTSAGENAVAFTRKEKPDLVIIQIDEVLEKAKDVVSQILASSPAPKIIVLTMFDDPKLAQEVLGLGTSAYIHKSASVEELLAALRSTAQSAAERVIMTVPRWELDASRDGAGDVLSRREFEVLLLAARGWSNRQIANRLGLAEPTVKRHLSNIYPKMGVGSRGEAVRQALENEWLTIHQITADVE
jgi:DNA-binding NarL/FixJ family response regulator